MSETNQSSTAWRGLHVTLVIFGFFAVWQLGVMLMKPPEYILPSPVEIFQEMVSAPLWYFDHTIRTLGATLLGFLLALVVGCLAAIGIVYSRFLENTLYTLLVALNSVPKIALAPLFIIWFDIGIESKIAVSASIVFFVVFLNTFSGVREVNPI